MKTKESRFQVHDELTAPEGSVPILKGALAGGGQLPNFIGVLAGSPAVLRSYARFRSELRNGSLAYATQQRIALAVAEHQGSEYALSTLQRTARDAGLGMDEIALAREFDSHDEREAVLLRFVKALLETDGAPKRHLHEEAREAGWRTSRCSRRSPTWRSPPSGTSSPVRATCRSTAPPRTPGWPRRPRPRRRAGTMSIMATQRTVVVAPGDLLRPTTRRSSWWASAGPARSCSC